MDRSMSMSMGCRKAGMLAMATLVAAAIVGCGSSSSGSSSGSTKPSAGTSVKGPAGKPLVIGTMAPVNTPVASLPQVWAGVKAAANAINGAGGIGGRPLRVLTCNTQLDPNQEAACANQIVQSPAVAMIGASASTNGARVEQIQERAGLANVAATADQATSYQNSVDFPIDVYAATGTPCVSKAVGSTSGTQVSLALPSIVNEADMTSSVARKLSFQLKRPVGFPPTTSDYGPIAQSAVSSGTHYAIFNGSGVEDLGFLQGAASLGQQLKVCVNDNLTAGDLIKLGSAANNLYSGTSFPPFSAMDKIPLLRKFKKQMTAEQNRGDAAASLSPGNYNTLMLRAWLGVQVFKQVAERMHGDINRATFIGALRTAKVTLPGVVPTLNFAHPETIGVYTRIFNPMEDLEKWNVATKGWTLVSGGSINIVKDAIPVASVAK